MEKDEFYRLHADICKAISSPIRQAILEIIGDREVSVTELMERTGISQSNISQHLAKLRGNDVVSTRREGNNIYYSISNPKILEAYNLISEVLQQILLSKNKIVSDAAENNK